LVLLWDDAKSLLQETHRMMSGKRIALAVSAGLLGAAGLSGMAVLADIAAFSSRFEEGPADAAVVLGAAVFGAVPSPVFEERIRHGVALYKAGKVRMLVMTGGLGPGDQATEAEAARLWSLARGVPPEAIAVETRSRTTQENLAFAQPILAQHGLRTVLLVSDPLHMRRSVAIARRLGIEAAPSPTPTTRYLGWRSWTWFLGGEAYYLVRCRASGHC
jgi:uncharacterized SAM-binding protein YcdF (DUF218 family)